MRGRDGSYTAMVEHESAGSFAEMRKAEAISMVHHGLGWLLSDSRQVMSYDVLEGFRTAEAWSGDGHGTRGCESP